MRESRSACRTVAVWLVAFLVVATISLAQVGNLCAGEPTARILEYGTYVSKGDTQVPTQAETSGSVVMSGGTNKHLQTTQKIPLRLNQTFGFGYLIKGLEPGEHTIDDVTLHPSIPQPDGRVLTKSSHAQKLTVPAESSILGQSGWTFLEGFEYELVPGNWTMCVYIDGRPAVSMSFEVGKFDDPPAEDSGGS